MVKKVFLIVVAVVVAGNIGYWLGKRHGVLTPPDVKSFHEEALALVPSNAAVVASWDAGWMLESLVRDNLGLMPALDPDKTEEDLRKASKEQLGIDIMEARRAVLWASAKPEAFGILVEGDFEGSLQGGKKKKIGDHDVVRLRSGVYAALTRDGLLLGDRRGVRAGLARAEGKDDGLSSASRHHHLKALQGTGDGPMVVSVDLDAEGLKIEKLVSGLDSLALVLEADGSLSAALSGKPRALKKVQRAYQGLSELAATFIEKQLEEASERGRPFEVLSLTVLVHKLDDAVSALEMNHEDDLLTGRVQGAGSGAILAALGAAAAAFPMRRIRMPADEERWEEPARAEKAPEELHFQF